MERCAETEQKLDAIYHNAKNSLSGEVQKLIGHEKRTERGYAFPVNRDGKTMTVVVKFFCSLSEVFEHDHDVSAISEVQRGLPTISVQVLGFGDLSSYRLSQADQFSGEVKGDLERQVRYAYGLLE